MTLKERNVPALPAVRSAEEVKKAQGELYALMRDRLYGEMPPPPAKVEGKPVMPETECFAGKAVMTCFELSFDAPLGRASFPMTYLAPKDGRKHPFFVNISFLKEVPSFYLPAEEIIDRGYGVATFCYREVSEDGPEFDGIAPLFGTDREKPETWGKIGIWAYAASRVLDFILTLPEVDPDRVAVIGHSRLGKTALWAGANDPRFVLTISNESGCGGAALNRGKVGETLSGMTDVFPYWFSPAMQNLRGVRPEDLDFDAHQLLALIAPRYLLVGSAAGDEWADPESEMLAAKAASPFWDAAGEAGLLTEEEKPRVGAAFQGGRIGYHMRAGAHFMSRTDWNVYMDYRDLHKI
ncbi:MAG: hypothetical protein IKX85_01975 [Clostridia bacterium]|nr:hypothetical protein [Clostridia bacterium]